MQSGGAFLIEDLATGATAGSSRYYQLQPNQVTVGFTFLARQYWGGRYNRELKTLMLNHAFHFVDVVSFEIGAKNIRSRRAIEKIGAKLFHQDALDANPHVIYRIDFQSFQRMIT